MSCSGSTHGGNSSQTGLSINTPEVVLRDTFLSKIRTSKNSQAEFAEFDSMREDDDRRCLKWLTESIGRLLARDRLEWARKLQRKSLTSGAVNADWKPGPSGGGKLGEKI